MLTSQFSKVPLDSNVPEGPEGEVRCTSLHLQTDEFIAEHIKGNSLCGINVDHFNVLSRNVY